MHDDDDYEVGYGKPPKHTRFQKGQSGNPKGRPKGRRNFATELEEVLEAPVPVTQNGAKVHVSSRQAVLYRLREMALNGDIGPMKQLLELAERHEATKAATQAERGLTRDEAEILERFIAEIREGGEVSAGEDGATDDPNGDDPEGDDDP